VFYAFFAKNLVKTTGLARFLHTRKFANLKSIQKITQKNYPKIARKLLKIKGF